LLPLRLSFADASEFTIARWLVKVANGSLLAAQTRGRFSTSILRPEGTLGLNLLILRANNYRLLR
jgi:hypothetical protein